MLKKILTASLAAGALALNAPVALADAPVYDCNFNSVQQETATGQNYEGAAWGFAVHAEGGPVSIRCFITVNGTEVTSTPTGTGSGAATTQGRVTFAATETDVVVLWAEVTTVHGTTSTPYQTTNTQIPPQEVIDVLNAVFDTFADVSKPADAVICLGLKTAGVPGVINAATGTTGIYMDADDCDLWDAEGRIIDFDPYDD